MIRIALALAALFAFGCNSTEPESSSPIVAGTYQKIIIANDGKATVQIQFKSDGTYLGKNYVYLDDGSLNCLVSEGMGKYAVSGGTIKLTEVKGRRRTDCNNSLPTFEDKPDISGQIRNISRNSFEIYLEGDDETPAEWLRMTMI